MLKNKRFLSLLVAASLVLTFILPDMASATQLTVAAIRLGRLAPSAGAVVADGNDVVAEFKPATAPTTVNKVLLTFPTGFTLTGTTTTPVITGLPTVPSVTGAPGTLTGAVTAGGAGLGGTILVSGITTLTAGTLYGFDIPAGVVQNPSTGGAQYNMTMSTQNSSGSTLDTTSVPTYITSTTPGADQVAVNASVAPFFKFVLNNSSDTIPALTTTTVQDSTTPSTVTVSTNAPLGYTAYVKSKIDGLYSSTNTTTINGTTYNGATGGAAITAGSKGYGLVPTPGANPSVWSGSAQAVTLDPGFTNIAAGYVATFPNTPNTYESFMERNGYTNGDSVTFKERATVDSSVPYGNDYNDTLTFIAAGNY